MVAANLAEDFYREVVLTGIEISSWGRDLKTGQTLTDLVEAVCAAANCGVTLLATVHAASLQDLQGRPVGRALLACGVFRRAVVIEGLGADRRSRVEPLP